MQLPQYATLGLHIAMITTELTTIEKKIMIRAPRTRVWRSLTTAQDFGTWFGAEFKGSFQPGARLDMVSTGDCSTSAPFYLQVERMEPEHFFSWSWTPGATKPGETRSEEGTTLVEFTLTEVDGGTVVTVTESGFDRISLARRAKAFEENSKGWKYELNALEQYVRNAA